MEDRPPFSEIKSFLEFSKYYWYREELQQICKQLGIDSSGMKAELNRNIEEYFKGNLIRPKSKTPVKARTYPVTVKIFALPLPNPQAVTVFGRVVKAKCKPHHKPLPRIGRKSRKRHAMPVRNCCIGLGSCRGIHRGLYS